VTDRRRLQAMFREDLVREARRARVSHPDGLEREELIAAIIAVEPPAEPKPGGAIARSLLSRASKIVGQAVEVARSFYETREPRARSTPVAPPAAPAEEPTGAAEQRAEQAEPAPEPALATSTLARLYEDQGHADDAARIYGEVLARDPDDPAAKAGIARLRTDPPQAAVPARPPAPLRDVIDVATVDPTTVLASWSVSDEGVARAGRLLGAPGDLVLRAFGSYPQAGGVGTLSFDERISTRSGEWFLRGLRPAGVYHAAIGLLADDRFVPVARGGPARTPAGAPSPDRAVTVSESTAAAGRPVRLSAGSRTPIVTAARAPSSLQSSRMGSLARGN